MAVILQSDAHTGTAEWLTGVVIEGSLLTARPVDTIVRDPITGELFVSTNAVVAAYTQITNVSGSNFLALTFEAASLFTVSTQVGGRRFNRTGQQWTIRDVTLYREIAGTSGSTTIDVNIAGVTAYTTQANRPNVAFGEGNDAVDQGTALPDITSVAPNSYLSLDIDTIESGGPENLTVVVTVSY